MEALKNDGIYCLPAGRIGNAGLSKVNFKEVMFWSIISVSGRVVVKSGKITCGEDIRVRVREDYGIKILSE